MGEIAEMMIDGTLCEGCGQFMNEDPPGYPVRCSECGGEPDEDNEGEDENLLPLL